MAQILRDGMLFQREQGFVQWPDDFPDRQELAEEIRSGRAWLFLADGNIAGCFCLCDREPAYDQLGLEVSGPVLHKTALARNVAGHGLGHMFFLTMEKTAGKSPVWIDTHRDNARMRHVLEREGYDYVGEVLYPVGRRLVYVKKCGTE